jgi:preprotein translocase subunit SecY
MPVDASTFWWTQTILVLVAGSMFAVWLGERITEKGIGNGISLLITVGILARLPESFIAEIGMNKANLIMIVLEIVAFMLVVLFTILIVQGVRRIPLNTAKRIVGARAVEEQGARNYLPIKVNASGVMPIIFAQAIMTIPMMAFSKSDDSSGNSSLKTWKNSRESNVECRGLCWPSRGTREEGREPPLPITHYLSPKSFLATIPVF